MLRNIQVTDGWHVVRLSDVAMLGSGKSPRYRNDNGNVTVFGANGPIGLTDTSNFANGIAVGRVGASGSVHCVRAPVWLSDNVLSVEPHPEVLNLSFLYYVLVWAHLPALASKTAQPLLTQTELGTVRLPLPPLPEQRAIAAVLDSIDEAIERTEEVIAATERLRESLLHELLGRGVPGWHSEWKEVRGVGTIPADWEVVRLGDVTQTSTYGTNTRLGSSGEVPILRMNNIQGGELDLSDVRWADLTDSEKGHLNLVPGDILFNRTNSLELVGKIAIVRDLPQPISFASYLVRLRVREDLVNPLWLSALLWSGSCQSRIRRFATPGVSQANINPTSLKSLIIQLPSLAEQEATAAMSDGVGEAIDRARTEKNMLDILKASVVDALLTGRVRVSV